MPLSHAQGTGSNGFSEPPARRSIRPIILRINDDDWLCLGHYLGLHFYRNMICDALASLSEHYLQAFRVDIISSGRLRPSLGGSP